MLILKGTTILITIIAWILMVQAVVQNDARECPRWMPLADAAAHTALLVLLLAYSFDSPGGQMFAIMGFIGSWWTMVTSLWDDQRRGYFGTTLMCGVATFLVVGLFEALAYL